MRWLEKGTGERGPRGKAFGPKKRQALRFHDGTFAMSSRGMAPHHYLRDSIIQVRPEQQAIWSRARAEIARRITIALER